MSTLAEMKHEVAMVNREKGWYDDDRTFGDMIALLHSEVSEALEAYRRWELRDATKHPKIQKELDDEGQEHFYHVTFKPEGVGSELADVLIRLLDMCFRYEIDLEYWYHLKLQYNKTRPYRHGGKRL